jgi:hypothetical protein
MNNANDTILSYTFAPPDVFIASTSDLTLTIGNPIDNSPVEWKGGPNGDEIDVTFLTGSGADALLTQLPTLTSVSPPGFSCGLSGNYFAIKSTANTTLQPGDNIVVVFKNAVINGETGSTTTTINEYIADASNTDSISINKLPQELAVIAWLDPYVVGLYEQSNLNWQSAGGIGVNVMGFSGGTGTKNFPVQGDPPYPGTTTVNVPSTTEAQRIYTLQVYTGDNRHAQEQVTLTQNAPLITSFSADKGSPLKVDATVTLTWHSLFGAGTILTSNSGRTRNDPESPMQVNPGRELLDAYAGNFGNMPDRVVYTLAVNGFSQPAYSEVMFDMAPVGLAYFKYMERDSSGKLSGVKVMLDPDSWTAQKITSQSNDLTILTVYQPGGTSDVYYLGDGDTEHPQIQYFNAESKGDGQFEFTWVTANLDATIGLVLLPGNIKFDGDKVIQGSSNPINVQATTEYTLSGVGTNGDPIVSKLVVQVSS